MVDFAGAPHPRTLESIERYRVLGELEGSDLEGVTILSARDQLFPSVEVRLLVVSSSGPHQNSVDALRAQARRTALTSPELDVRIFEDLHLGLMGVAYRARVPANKTAVDAPPRPARLWWVAVGALAGTSLALALVLTLSAHSEGETVDGGATTGAETDEGDEGDSEGPAEGRRPPTGTPPTSGPACGADEVAISTGCVDALAVRRNELDACGPCRLAPPSVLAPTDAASGPDALACAASKGRSSDPARCARWDEARVFCAQQGKRLPSLQEWTAAAAGFVTRSTFEWTSSQWKEGGIMRRTGAEFGGPSQMHVALSAPNLGFRCMKPR